MATQVQAATPPLPGSPDGGGNRFRPVSVQAVRVASPGRATPSSKKKVASARRKGGPPSSASKKPSPVQLPRGSIRDVNRLPQSMQQYGYEFFDPSNTGRSLGGASESSTPRDAAATAVAAEVFATLPASLQAALEQLDAALAALPQEEAEVHMRRCVASGLWDPSAGVEQDAGGTSPAATATGDSRGEERLARGAEGGLTGGDDESQASDAAADATLEPSNRAADRASDGDASSSREPPDSANSFNASSNQPSCSRGAAAASGSGMGSAAASEGPPVFFSTRPLVVREGWELDSPMLSTRITPDTTLIILQTKDLPDGTRRARVALENDHTPQGWVSWVTANGSIGLVPRNGSVHLNLPPPAAATPIATDANAPSTPTASSSSVAGEALFSREGGRGRPVPRRTANTSLAGRGTMQPLSALKGSLARENAMAAPSASLGGVGGGGAVPAAGTVGFVGGGANAPARRAGAANAPNAARSRGAPAGAGGASSSGGGSGPPLEAPIGMPTDLPYDAERLLSRFGKQGVKEFAVPLGDGWMQRAGRGAFRVVEEAKGKGDDGPCMLIESIEPQFYLLTYDQTPDAHLTRCGHYKIEANIRSLAGATIKEQPYVAIVINWQRTKSTVTNPCFTALVLTAGSWRIDQYSEGQQTTLAEVHDTSLKSGNGLSLAAPWQRVVIEIRGDRLSMKANGKPVFGSFVIPSTYDASLAANRVAKSSPLTGPVGIATFRSRAQLRKFEISPLELAEGEVLPDYDAKPPFMGGDPKLVDIIEGEMLESSPNVAWESIGGLGEAKLLLHEAVVLPLLIPDYFAAAACRAAWKGVLLFGPPGTGKTLLARAVASLGKTAFFNISASSLVSYHFGESEKLARTLFALARHHAPSIVFFDEVDALVSTRGAANEHEASRRIKSELLVQMDGIGSSALDGQQGQVMVLATSNKPWDLDEAMRRRLERRIYVPLPELSSREEMLQIHLKGVTLAADVDWSELAKLTQGYSGADMQLVCRDASMMPMRRAVEGKTPKEIVELHASGLLEGAVSMADFQRALRRTQPSTAANEHDAYTRWNNEYGCHH